jgi:hypothetical protein
MMYGGGIGERPSLGRFGWGGNAKTRPHRRMQESYQVLRAARSSNYGWTVFVFRIRAIFMI